MRKKQEFRPAQAQHEIIATGHPRIKLSLPTQNISKLRE